MRQPSNVKFSIKEMWWAWVCVVVQADLRSLDHKKLSFREYASHRCRDLYLSCQKELLPGCPIRHPRSFISLPTIYAFSNKSQKACIHFYSFTQLRKVCSLQHHHVMKDFNAIPSAIGLVLLIVGGVLHYNGALVVKSSPSRKLLVAKVIVQPPSQKEQQQRRRSPWNLDSWCQEHSSSSGEGCDKPEEALSIAVDSSESMVSNRHATHQCIVCRYSSRSCL